MYASTHLHSNCYRLIVSLSIRPSALKLLQADSVSVYPTICTVTVTGSLCLYVSTRLNSNCYRLIVSLCVHHHVCTTVSVSGERVSNGTNENIVGHKGNRLLLGLYLEFITYLSPCEMSGIKNHFLRNLFIKYKSRKLLQQYNLILIHINKYLFLIFFKIPRKKINIY